MKHQCDFLGLTIQFFIGGFVGLVAGYVLLFSRKYRILVEMPYSPYFVIACGLILAGLAMLYGDRLWSSDHIIPHRRPKHSNASRIGSWLLVTFGVLLATTMFISSQLLVTNDLEREEAYEHTINSDFEKLDSRVK